MVFRDGPVAVRGLCFCGSTPFWVCAPGCGEWPVDDGRGLYCLWVPDR